MAGHVFRHTNDAQPPARSRAIRLVSVDVGRVDVDIGRADVGKVDAGKLGVVVDHVQQNPAAGAHTIMDVQMVIWNGWRETERQQ